MTRFGIGWVALCALGLACSGVDSSRTSPTDGNDSGISGGDSSGDSGEGGYEMEASMNMDASERSDARVGSDASDRSDAAVSSDASSMRDALVDTGVYAEAGPADAGLPGIQDGGPLYNPCPPKGKPCVALPLGDSITQGAHSPAGGSYRQELFHMAVSHGQSITFVGSQASGPGTVDARPFPRAHEGHGGFTISQLSALVAANNTISTYKPDIVLLQIGTNGTCATCDANLQIMQLGPFVDQILKDSPHALVIVAQITATMDDARNAQVQTYNAGVRALVQSRAAAGMHVATVDLYTPMVNDPTFKTDYLADQVHPNGAGYNIVGDAWYTVVGPLLQ
jgi:lysophospholipase L1-like esterase